jgi:hypothetical protein
MQNNGKKLRPEGLADLIKNYRTNPIKLLRTVSYSYNIFFRQQWDSPAFRIGSILQTTLGDSYKKITAVIYDLSYNRSKIR